MRAANTLATGGLIPDLTVLFNVPATLGLSRAERRGPTDRMEREGQVFMQQVADAFARFSTPEWQAKHPEAGPIASVDAIGSPDEVQQRVMAVIAQRMPDLRQQLEQVA